MRDNRRMNPTHVCIILTSKDVPFTLIDIILVTIAISAAQRRSGPARLLQTAEILYNSGRSSPPNLKTNSSDLASVTKQNVSKMKGEICEISAKSLEIELTGLPLLVH
jgi:hypothetical protein